jgi:CRISPR-associated Csx2 family protein
MTNTGMTHTLVTFLGKGREDPRTGYRETTYRFPDGSQETTHFFGLALAGHLEPDRLVVLGTARSMWGALVEHVAAGGEEENARLALIDAEEAGTVDQLLLDRLSGVLRRAVGRDVMPRLIPFGATPEEQRDILQTIAAVAGEGEVSFDLTHGFRHLGMVGMLSAFMLERIGRLKVRSLWYGALDMTARDTGITPVLQLDGLNAIQRWIGALDRFDASGDYGVFAPLLEADGVPRDKARCLEEAAFFERSFNLGDAARRLRTFAEVVRRPLPGASGLFQARLAERLAWIAEPDLAAQQRALAQQYLERADFVRAAQFAWEALVTGACKGYDPYDRLAREATQKALDAKFKGSEPYTRLKYLRNALAHGTPPGDECVRWLLRSSDRLRAALGEAMRCLLP